MKLREYVDDTEDYINIMLDDKQNHLLQMGVMLTTATLVVSAFVAVAGIFGMNVEISIFKDSVHGMTRFMWTVGGGSAGTLFLYVIAIAWCKHRRLLEWILQILTLFYVASTYFACALVLIEQWKYRYILHPFVFVGCK